MKVFLAVIFLMIVALYNSADAEEKSRFNTEEPFRTLLIVAHRDDKYEMAATVCRITQELGGSVDQIVITDGEGVPLLPSTNSF